MSTPTHIHVITSCTGTKISTDVPLPAEQLYQGQHHVRLMRGVAEARQAGFRVDLSIVSAEHGVVAGSSALMPYERTFQGKSVEQRRSLARSLGVPRAARGVLDRQVDLHVVLLGDDYLDACELDTDVQPSAPVLLVCGAGASLRLAPMPDITLVPLKVEDTRRFRCGLVALKGEIGARLLTYIADERPAMSALLGPGLLDQLQRVDARRRPALSTLF
jgi:hypothetical protein